MNQDEIIIEILPNGDIKVTTDEVSGPNHSVAEGLIAFLSQHAGGPVSQVRKPGHTHHHHGDLRYHHKH